MKEVCILPNYNRPEFASLCIEHIKRNPDYQKLDYVFAVDMRIGGTICDELLHVLEGLDAQNDKLKFCLPHDYRGNSYNLLSAVKRAVEQGYDLIHLIEDDVMVSDDYFRWHRKTHETGEFFASVASKSPRSPKISESSTTKNYVDVDYAPYGVCFRAEMAKKYLLPHICDRYFKDMGGYVSKAFPNHRFGTDYPEQDGLIYRIVTTNQLQCAFPTVPRCFHAGFYGYNRTRSNRFQGTLESKIAAIRAILHDKEALNALSWEFPDLEPCNLIMGHWDSLEIATAKSL